MSEDNNKALLKVEIVTPESIFYSKNAYMVTMPGSNGEMGVLFGHVSLLTGLQAGLVTIYGDGMQIIDRIFVTEGFAEITAQSAILLVQQASFLADHDLAKVQSDLMNLKEDLELAKAEDEIILIEKNIQSIEALLAILQR